eukprot:UN00868
MQLGKAGEAYFLINDEEARKYKSDQSKSGVPSPKQSQSISIGSKNSSNNKTITNLDLLSEQTSSGQTLDSSPSITKNEQSPEPLHRPT